MIQGNSPDTVMDTVLIYLSLCMTQWSLYRKWCMGSTRAGERRVSISVEWEIKGKLKPLPNCRQETKKRIDRRYCLCEKKVTDWFTGGNGQREWTFCPFRRWKKPCKKWKKLRWAKSVLMGTFCCDLALECSMRGRDRERRREEGGGLREGRLCFERTE